MKKKGLIISTVVMVVVLIASLTTATYAWFTAAGSATVNDISFGVTAASDLLIGVSKNNIYNASAGWDDFVADSTTYSDVVSTGNRGTWTGATAGLGLSIDTGLSLGNLQKAVYSFSGVKLADGTTDLANYNATSNKIKEATQTAYSRGSDATKVTTGLVKDGVILKAAGNGTSVTVDSCEPTVRNTDYLDVVFGVAPSKPDVLEFGCLISVDNALAKTSLGMNAAIHVIYSTDGTNYSEYDIYGTNSSNTLHTAMQAPTVPSATIKTAADAETTKTVNYTSSVEYVKGDANLWIPLRTAQHATDYSAVEAQGLKQLHLIIYICGPDGDCITSATGASALIKIEFIDINSSMYQK